MKRIFIPLILTLLTLISCADSLEIKPEDRQSITNSFDDDSELMAFIITIQGQVQRLIASDPHQYMGAQADRCDNTSFNQLRNLTPATVKGSLYSDWSPYYDAIYMCNLILENIDQAEGNISQERIDFYVGQAKFFKGWMYFELARIWGNTIITTGTNNFDAYGNSKDYEVVAEAIKNMESAYELLGHYGELKNDSGDVLLSKQYGNKGAAAGLLAHMYAWQGSMAELYSWPGVDAKAAYTSSVEWSTKLISGEASAGYSLAPDVETMADQTFYGWEPIDRVGATESILEGQAFYNTDNSGAILRPLMVQYTTWPVNTVHGTSNIEGGTSVAFKLNATTVQEMYKNDDERKDVYFYKVDSMATAGHPFSYPHKAKEGNFRVYASGYTQFAGLNSNLIYIRLAGIYLLRAECYAKLGDEGNAISDLNTIRARAKADLYPAVGDTDLRYTIFKEREKELCMENGRYYDVLRNNYIDTELPEAFGFLSDQDIQDGALYLNIGDQAFVNNTLLKQNIYWNRVE